MEDVRICYIGDSLVHGVGDPTLLGWSGRLSRISQSSKHYISHYNLGVIGDTSSNILERWELEANRRLPNFSINCVVFSFGLSDSIIENKRVRVSLIDSMKNARAIIGRAKVKYNVAMVGPTSVIDEVHNARIKGYDDAYSTVCGMLGINYLSIFNILLNDMEWREDIKKNDNIHPTEKGYEMIANHIYNWEGWWFA